MENINITIEEGSQIYVSIDGSTGGTGNNGGSGVIDYNSLINKPALKTVATTGSYADLTNKPYIFTGSYIDLTNKPDLKTVATTGSYTDLINRPYIFTGSYTDLTNKPDLKTVATTGSYTDLINKPYIFTGSYIDLTNKPDLKTVATTGSYTDLINKPSIPDVAVIQGEIDDLQFDVTAIELVNTNQQTQINNKVDKVTGKQLSTEDYSTTEKSKLAGLSNYSLPISSTTILGGIKIGSGLSIDGSGVVSATATGSGDMLKSVYDTDNSGIVDNSEKLNSQSATFYLNRANHTGSQTASTISDYSSSWNTLFNAKVLDDISDVNFTSLTDQQSIKYDSTTSKWVNYTPASAYTLPTASNTVLGGVKVDNTSITISSGIISATYSYTLPTASNTVLGGVKVDGTTITIASGVISAVSSGGGLTNFADSINTATPNATIPVAMLKAANSATSVDMVLSPKGNGAMSAQVADNTATGGNKRGNFSVDWQRNRNNANQVASGIYTFIGTAQWSRNDGQGSSILSGYTNYIDSGSAFSTICSGQLNEISGAGSTSFIGAGNSNKIQTSSDTSAIVTGFNNSITSNSVNSFIGGGQNNSMTNYAQYSSVVGGDANTNNGGNYAVTVGGRLNINVNGTFGFIGAGQSNEVRNQYAVVLAGNTNKATALHSICLYGDKNLADAPYSLAMGRFSNTKAMIGSIAESAGNFDNLVANNGNAQSVRMQLRGKTSSSSSVRLTSDNSSNGTNSNQFLIKDNEIKNISGIVVVSDISNVSNYSKFNVDITVSKYANVITIVSNETTNPAKNSVATTNGYGLTIATDASNSAVSLTITKTGGGDIAGLARLVSTEMTPN